MKGKTALVLLVCILGLVSLMTAGVSAATLVNYGDYKNGTISAPGIWAGYVLNASAGDPLYVRLKTSWPFSGQIRVHDPNGDLIASSEGTYGTELSTTLPLTGRYTLLVGDPAGDNTGTYDLFLQRTRDPAKPLPVQYGTYVNGTILYPALYKTYTFNATVGDPLYVRLKTSWPFSGQVRLYAPNGTLLASPEGTYGTELSMNLPLTGRYTLLVGDSGGDNTGTYDLYLQRTRKPAKSIPVAYGAYVNGTILYPALYKTYTFNATVGDPLYVRLKTSWPFSGQIRLYAPNGTLLASPEGTYGTELTMNLPAGGTYTLLVGDSGGEETGIYHLYLQRTRKPAKPIPVAYGAYVNGTILYPALYKTYTFNATAGDPLYVRLKTSWPFSGQVRLYAPNGTALALPEGTYGTELSRILPLTGTYTLLVGDSGGEETGIYHLYLQRTRKPAKPIPIAYGTYANGTIPYPALYKTYTFNATAGDPLYIRLKTSWPFSGQVRLYAPNGTGIAMPEGSYGTELTITLPLTGVYTLLVGDSGGEETGIYHLYLQKTRKPAQAVPLRYGDYVNGTIPYPALYKTYTFNATAGDPLYARLKTSWPFSGQVRLYAPNGTGIALPEGTYGTELTITLPLTGTYTLLAGDSGGEESGIYHLYLQRTRRPAKAVPITWGTYANGTIPYPAIYKTYTFNATAGDPLYLRLKTSWSFSGQVRLYAPNGTALALPEGTYGTELTMTLPENGGYTLLAGDSGGEESGICNLYLQRTRDPGKSIAIAYGDSVNGTILYPALYKTYTFAGSTGDHSYIRLNTSWPFSGQIRLYAPNGTRIASPEGTYGTEVNQTLPATGNYTLLAGDSGGDNTGTYDLFLQLMGTV